MEKIKNFLKKFTEPNNLKTLVYGFGIAVVAILIFQAGVFVGFQKANFSYRWGDNYQKFFEMRGRMDNRDRGFERTFGGDERGNDMFPGMLFGQEDFFGAHGISGKIISVKLPNIVVAGDDKVEKVITIDNQTILRQFKGDLRPEELKAGERVIVVGNPSDRGTEIIAKMIRVVPEIGDQSASQNNINASSSLTK